jgi:ferredoxin
MAYIITRLCRDCVDTGCVAVCPVDCIYRYQGSDTAQFPKCPWQAIFEEEATPAVCQDDIKLNYAIVENAADFKVAQHEKIPHPTAEQVAANKKKWGL